MYNAVGLDLAIKNQDSKFGKIWFWKSRILKPINSLSDTLVHEIKPVVTYKYELKIRDLSIMTALLERSDDHDSNSKSKIQNFRFE